MKKSLTWLFALTAAVTWAQESSAQTAWDLPTSSGPQSSRFKLSLSA